MVDSPGQSVYSPDVSPPSGASLLSPSLVSFAQPQSKGSSSSSQPASSSATSAGFTTILTDSTGGGAKSSSTTSDSSSSSHNSISVVQGSPQNLSVVSGNVVIPQTILQANNSALLYHPGQGLVYATPANLPEGVVLNLGQEQGGPQQQYITIPVSLSLTPAQQQQLLQGNQLSTPSSSFSSSSSRRDKRK